jgi:hypothetical protein
MSMRISVSRPESMLSWSKQEYPQNHMPKAAVYSMSNTHNVYFNYNTIECVTCVCDFGGGTRSVVSKVRDLKV